MTRKKMMKNFDYNFDDEKEFSIYRKACGKKLSKREKKIVGDKIFTRYNEWSGYVESKYSDVSVNSLCEFRRFLNHKARIKKNNSGAFGTVIFPFLFMMLGALSSFVMQNVVIVVIFYILLACRPVKTMLKEYTRDSLEIVFYEDYIEVIEQLIKKKRG